jgi:hypothetical protein
VFQAQHHTIGFSSSMTKRTKSVRLDPVLERSSNERIFPRSHIAESLHSPNGRQDKECDKPFCFVVPASSAMNYLVSIDRKSEYFLLL